MTEQEWSACRDPETMLVFVTQSNWSRKARLFACACGWQVANRLTDPRCLAALQVAEQFADNQADMDEIIGAFEDTYGIGSEQHGPAARAAALISLALGEGNNYALEAYQDLIDQTPKKRKPARRKWAGEIVRCIWGPLPFRRVSVKRVWATATVVALARGIYEERAFDRMSVLADALQEARCRDQELLAHCVASVPHARGCWVIDLLLGRE